MTSSAIIMMLVAMAVVWGGLAYHTWSLRFRPIPPLAPEVETFISAVEAEGESVAKAAAKRVNQRKGK
ncbi:hypothetical protein BK816_00265 [Boudabousia tangfeifanii]|uniref:Uncharacterized protein n=1 Tax=Boudabousia tangfeifanii TaxID=1912795 RepID=A0A1D9MI21_9ACTO|nr:methionine/alanine import family NSS transporter small subunit [Boudabousia tangfeifanii]AOZ71916.1 hypothetical protein BK816_00265 [Boudabousia tangfeifanii]